MAKRRTSSKKRASSSKKRTAKKRAPAAIPISAPMCSPCDKWTGLGIFFLGALIILNGWRGWTEWHVFVGLLVGLYGLWYYFKYG